jgi:hypothetical protein
MIKITKENAAAIDQALKSVNGKASSHTYTRFSEIWCVADEAEKQLAELNIPKALRKGARYVSQSGETLPSAYKYAATTMTVTIERKSGGWYLSHVAPSTLYSRTKPRKSLFINPAQDAEAIANVRKAYAVIAA